MYEDVNNRTTGWCCKDPKGKLVVWTTSSSKNASIAVMKASTVGYRWELLKRKGYECVRVVVSEVEQIHD